MFSAWNDCGIGFAEHLCMCVFGLQRCLIYRLWVAVLPGMFWLLLSEVQSLLCESCVSFVSSLAKHSRITLPAISGARFERGLGFLSVVKKACRRGSHPADPQAATHRPQPYRMFRAPGARVVGPTLNSKPPALQTPTNPKPRTVNSQTLNPKPYIS